VTELAYLVDLPSAYVRTFRARVTALPPGAVVLDRTYFYPTGGGQPADHGELTLEVGSKLSVVDVTKSGASVVHRVQGSPSAIRSLAVGAELEGTIEWERRHRHMRLHTAQHLLSARIFERFGLRTRRANLSGVTATLDLDGAMGPDTLPALADDLREAYEHPRPVRVRYVPRAEWDRNPSSERSGLVPLPRQVDPVRVVEIEATDTCPCGGTHVASTSELGALRLVPPAPIAGGASRVALTLVEAVWPSRPG
jgi:misacylated tRNA(Ala) deacylase